MPMGILENAREAHIHGSHFTVDNRVVTVNSRRSLGANDSGMDGSS